MALSDQDVARINAALKAAKASPKCPACGSTDVRLNGEMVAVPTAQHARTVGAEPTGHVMMCVARVCAQCGHAALHSVVALGLDGMI